MIDRNEPRKQESLYGSTARLIGRRVLRYADMFSFVLQLDVPEDAVTDAEKVSYLTACLLMPYGLDKRICVPHDLVRKFIQDHSTDMSLTEEETAALVAYERLATRFWSETWDTRRAVMDRMLASGSAELFDRLEAAAGDVRTAFAKRAAADAAWLRKARLDCLTYWGNGYV